MKKMISVLCTISLLAGLLVGFSASAAVDSGTKAEEEFSCWLVPDSWQHDKSKEQKSLNDYYRYDAEAKTYTRAGQEGWRDYKVTFLYTKETYQNFVMEFDAKFGEPTNPRIWLSFGASDPANSKNVDWDSYGYQTYLEHVDDQNVVNSEHWLNKSNDWWGAQVLNNDKSVTHHIKMEVKDQRYSLYMDGTKIADNWDLGNYTGGYIGIGTGDGQTVFSNITITSVEKLLEGYTAYQSNNDYGWGIWTDAWAGTLNEVNATDVWDYRDGRFYRKSNTGKMSYLYSNESYTDMEITFDYTAFDSNNDASSIYVGVGASEKGGGTLTNGTLKDPSSTVVRFYKNGALLYAPTNEGRDGWIGGEIFSTDDTQKAVHKAQVTVSDNVLTVTIDGRTCGSIPLQNYRGGYVFIGGFCDSESFSVPEIRSTAIAEEVKNTFAGYSAEVNGKVYRPTGFQESAINENWYMDSDNLIHKKNDGKVAALYLKESYGQNIRMTFQYKTTVDEGNSGAFIGFGAPEKGADWFRGENQTTANIIRIYNSGYVGCAPVGEADDWLLGVPSPGNKPWFQGDAVNQVHTAVVELKYDTLYLWIDGVYHGTHRLMNYAEGMIFLGAYNGDVAFSIPVVEPITPANYGTESSAAYGKSALFIGDSISYGAGDLAAWASRLKYQFNLNMKNKSRSSWIVAKGDLELGSIQTQLEEEINHSYDYIVVEGGINDIMRNSWDENRCKLGAISSSYALEDFDVNTFAGGLEAIFYHATTEFKGAKVGYILTYKPSESFINGAGWTNAEAYVSAAKAICEKWDIPILNMWDDTELNEKLHAEGSPYLTDGLHFSHDGYELVNESIARWFEALTVPKDRVAITVTAETKDGIKVPANLTGGGTYKIGADVTVTAPEETPTGFEFLGWYEGETLLSDKKTYSFTAEKAQDLVARYKMVGKGTIEVVDGETRSYEKTFGQTMSVSAKNPEQFLHWTNAYGMVVSTESTYEFTVITSDTLTACYKTEEQKAIVVWQSDYGQVIKRGEYADSDAIVEPDWIPAKIGYTAKGWSLNAVGIQNKIAEGNKLITVTPNYTLNSGKFTITVTDGILNKGGSEAEYAMNELVTVTADEPEGKTFSYWKVKDKEIILGYALVYQFYATQDYSIEAVFDAGETAKGTATITQVLRDETNRKLSFVAMLTVPEGCKIEFGGILATNSSSIAESGLTKDNARYVRGMAYDGTALRYTWTKGNVSDTSTWYVRPYVVYRDANGVLYEILGNMEAETLSGQATAGVLNANELPVKKASY